jgi:hypothetical protein
MPRPGPGQLPAHLQRKNDARVLAARLAPVGHANMEALQRHRGLPEKAQVQRERRAMELIRANYTGTWTVASVAMFDPDKRGGFYLLQYCEPADCLLRVAVTGFGPAMREGHMIETDQGTMLLRGSTVVARQNECIAPSSDQVSPPN